MAPELLAQYLEEKCSLDGATGRVIHRLSGRPVAAIVPVHLYGQTADMDAILELADRYRLVVIEDACQAHGAEYFSEREQRWRKAGSMGKAAAFSFYPGKNLGACGEGGAVTTNDPALAQHIRMLRDHGQARKYYHEMEGYNGRLDSIQAGILRVKLAHLPEWNEKRRQAACRYHDLFGAAGGGVALPYEPSWAKAVYHLFVIRVPDRDDLQKRLADERIGTGVHYPIPLHLQKAYECLGHPVGSFPVAERVAPEILSLPMFPGLELAQQSRVVEQVLASLSAVKR
jgi:dTDP-4-amino-4,6-dideoxygalactose transaminase